MSTFGLSFVFVFPSLQLVFFRSFRSRQRLILPFADNWKVQPGLAARATEGISCSSYSTYLAHLFCSFLPIGSCIRRISRSRDGWPPWPSRWPCSLEGYLLYLLTERPLMQVRERWNRRYASMRKRQHLRD
ncbi:MAG: hypothetical protein WDO13_13995 [Verrucomicrobiota bacterium]